MAPAASVRPDRWPFSKSIDLHPAAILKSRAMKVRLFTFKSPAVLYPDGFQYNGLSFFSSFFLLR